jgi:hypothetical protein
MKRNSTLKTLIAFGAGAVLSYALPNPLVNLMDTGIKIEVTENIGDDKYLDSFRISGFGGKHLTEREFKEIIPETRNDTRARLVQFMSDDNSTIYSVTYDSAGNNETQLKLEDRAPYVFQGGSVDRVKVIRGGESSTYHANEINKASLRRLDQAMFRAQGF